MDRRLVAGAATGVAMVLLVLAASSGPVRLWITPPGDVGPSSIGTAGPLDTVAPPDSVPPDRGDPHNWGEVFFELLGVLLIVLAVTVAVWIVRAGMWPRLRRRGVRERSSPAGHGAAGGALSASWRSTLTLLASHWLGVARATRSSPVGCSSNAMPPQRGCRVTRLRRRRSTSNVWWRHHRSTRHRSGSWQRCIGRRASLVTNCATTIGLERWPP